MEKRGRRPRTLVDREVCRFWVRHLAAESGASGGREFAIRILGRPELANAFTGYEAGAHGPSGPHLKDGPPSNVMLAEAAVPGSARFLLSPIWRKIQGLRVEEGEMADAMIALAPEYDCLRKLADQLKEDPAQMLTEREISFPELQALVLGIFRARDCNDRELELRLSALFARLRPLIRSASYMAGFEHSLLPAIEETVGTTHEDAKLGESRLQPNGPKITLDASEGDRRASNWRRSILVGLSLILFCILIFADNPRPHEVLLILIPLVLCILATVDGRAYFYRSARSWGQVTATHG